MWSLVKDIEKQLKDRESTNSSDRGVLRDFWQDMVSESSLERDVTVSLVGKGRNMCKCWQVPHGDLQELVWSECEDACGREEEAYAKNPSKGQGIMVLMCQGKRTVMNSAGHGETILKFLNR